jgi:hypothetical protein
MVTLKYAASTRSFCNFLHAQTVSAKSELVRHCLANSLESVERIPGKTEIWLRRNWNGHPTTEGSELTLTIKYRTSMATRLPASANMEPQERIPGLTIIRVSGENETVWQDIGGNVGDCYRS